jgi:flagellar hook-length control protein FliK
MAILAGVDTPVGDAPTLTDDSLPADALPVAAATPVDPTGMLGKTDVPMDAAAFIAQSMQWTTAEPKGGESTGGRQALARGGASGAGPQGLQTDVVSEAVGKPVKQKADATSSQTPFGVTLTSSAATNGQNPAEGRALQFIQKLESMQVQPTAVASAVASATISVGHEELVRDRSIFKPIDSEAPTPLQPVVTSAPSTTVFNASGVMTPPEVYVAEQVKYWISNDVQNAEMKLDGIGNNPVEVSISMQGNEAHVAFRTDELQAREVLENASLHLKELLQREGLVLSGVSVDTAGAGTGDSGAQERKARQGARTALVASAQPILANTASVSGRAAGRALDLFV